MTTDRMPGRLRLVPTALIASLLVLPGCASLAPDTQAAGRVAEQFHRSLSDSDGGAACDELAPETVAVLEQDSGDPCADAVLAEDIPDAGEVLESQAYGQVAQVVLNGDVVFLASFGDRWRVTAAGCTHRDSRPYHCSIDGG
jgi:hypothetical protein